MKFTINSLILQVSTRLMLPVLLLFSVFLLFGGHNEPGGGFVGGLVAAAAFALYAMAFDPPAARRIVRFSLQGVTGFGLLLAGASGLVALAGGLPYLQGLWMEGNGQHGTELPIPLLAGFKVGTPMLFDIGVYLVVVGVTLMMILALGEEEG